MNHFRTCLRSPLLIVTALALWASSAQAQEQRVIDQDTMLSYNGYAGGWTDCWQSFTAGKSGRLARLQVWAYLGGATTLTLYAGEGTGGTVLFSTSFMSSPSGGVYEVAVSGDVIMTPGAKYTIRLATPAGVNWVVGTYSYASGTSNVYGTGADFGFRTYLYLL